MASTISAGTTSGTAIAIAGDTSGVLALQTNNGTTAVTVTTAQNVGIGTTTPTDDGGYGKIVDIYGSTGGALYMHTSTATNYAFLGKYNASTQLADSGSAGLTFATASGTTPVERMRIDTSGNVLVGKTSPTPASVGCEMRGNGIMICTRSAGPPMTVNRTTDDGDLVALSQDSTQEGAISVSGTTVSYNGGHLSRYAQTVAPKDETLLKGTILSNLDEINVYIDADGNQVANEQLNKVKVSDEEGDINVAGVFVNWTFDEAHNVNEINMAMTGDMIIRIAQGTTVQKGDLLMSAGDGTAKPQSDDIVRSKTIAKVTSNHVTYTYADGSYCVPCVLMAC